MDQQGYDGVEKGGRGAVMRGGRERSPQGRVLCAVLSPSVVPDSLPWTVACQAPLSLEFSRQEHWSGLPFPSPMLESEVIQLCPTLSNPMDCSLPGSSIPGILQARVLEWVAIAFS